MKFFIFLTTGTIAVVFAIQNGCNGLEPHIERKSELVETVFTQLTVRNYSSELVWVESIKSGKRHDFQVGYLKTKAEASIHLSPLPIPESLILEWWRGDRNRPEEVSDIFTQTIDYSDQVDVPDGMLELTLILDLGSDNTWKSSFQTR